MQITKEGAEYALQCLTEDIEMLSDGSWEPDNDSCDASLEMLGRIDTYLKRDIEMELAKKFEQMDSDEIFHWVQNKLGGC